VAVTPRTRLALALFAAALAVRPLAVSVGPLLPSMQADLGMSPVVSGLLGTVPIICLGLFAPVGAWLAGRLRPRPALGLALVLVVLFGAARAGAPNVEVLVALTVGLGIGMGLAGSLPAMIIKARAPGHPGFMTGMYGTGVVAGAAAATALIVLLAQLADGWRGATLLLSIPVLAAVLIGYRLLGPDPHEVRAGEGLRIHWADAIAWLMALLFGLQSFVYWGLVIWLAEVLQAMGWTSAGAGTMVTVFQLSSLAAVLGAGYIADRFGTRRMQLRVVSIGFTLALAGLAAVPALTVLWVALAGASLGMAFPLILALPVDYASDDRDAGSKASLMLLFGYLVAAVGPTAVGLVRDATDGVAPVFWLLAAMGAAFFVLTAWVRPSTRATPLDVPITTD
jgi:CP family cyanate transporter-like MFS transporter